MSKPRKLVYGIGRNDADYVVKKWETINYTEGKRKQRLVWVCPYYQTWVNMLKRCYSTKSQERQPTYRGCTVAEDWHVFSNFRAWMRVQNWEGLQLDKDLLIRGNKVYGPDTCVFITQTVNLFTNDSSATRGEWLIGVYWDKEKAKFVARCSNPFTKKMENLGRFDSEHQAHEAWRKRKLELAHELAAIQTDKRVAEALINRYSKPQIILGAGQW